MPIEDLYAELAGGAELVRQLLAGMTQAEAVYKPSPQAWSALEVLCHLSDEEREDFRPHLDLMLHRPAEPWPPIDPAGWVTARRYNARDLAESLEAFVRERNQSVAWLKGLAAPNWEAEYPTPFGTTMKAGDMLAAWVAHDNLHLRQLVELRRTRLVNLCQPYDVRYAGEW